MSLEHKLKESIEELLKSYENKEGVNLSQKDAKDISHIRAMMQQNLTLIDFRILLMEYISKNMTQNIFAFLHLFNDLKYSLKSLLAKQEYSLINCFNSTKQNCIGLSNGSTNQNSNYSNKKDNLDSLHESRLLVLENEVTAIKEHNLYYKTKNEQLEQTLIKINEDYIKFKEEIEQFKTRALKAEAQVERLSLCILQKDEEISNLKLEISQLKKNNNVNIRSSKP
jgi:hypothetical protein